MGTDSLLNTLAVAALSIIISMTDPGMALRIARLQDVLWQATAKNENYVIATPTQNITCAKHELLMLSEIVWTLTQ